MRVLGGSMFRKVVMADKKEILDLIKDVWDGTDYIGNVFDGWIMEPFGEFTCMILDDRIVAVSKMTQLNSECVWFEGLRVESSYRKRGLGKAFLEYQIKRAIELGYKNVQLSTYYENLSIKIIEAFGFKKIEEFKLNEITIDKEESNLDLKKVLKLKTYQPTRKYYFFDFSFFEVENKLLEELIAIGDVYQYKNSSIILTAYKAKGNFLSLVDFTGDYEEVYEFCIERAREMKVEAIVSVSQDDEFIRFMKQKKEVNTSNDELRDVYLYEMDLEDEKC